VTTGAPATADPTGKATATTAADRSVVAKRAGTFWQAVRGVLWERQYGFVADPGTFQQRLEWSYRGFIRAGTGREDWNTPALPQPTAAGPQLPTGGPALNLPCDACRQGDALRVRSLAAAGVGQYAEFGDASHLAQDDTATEQTRLSTGGTVLAPSRDAYGLDYYRLPAGAATHTLTDTGRSALAAVAVSTSTDGGAHWHPAAVSRSGTGWQVATRNPATGTVSLRVTARDTNGNTVDQTITDAYAVH
jgi:hypothetical protein